MITITEVLEPALTVSPTLMPTETTVPLMGLVRFASVRDCWATVRSACAESIAAWSAAICCGVSEAAPEPEPLPFPEPEPLPAALLGLEPLPAGLPLPLLGLPLPLPVFPVADGVAAASAFGD